MSAHDDVNPQDEAWTSNVYGMSRAVRPGPDAVSRVTAGVRRRRRARAAAATVGVAAVVAGVSVGAAGLPLDG